jgi:putative tricarboxylic transport membrane protein
VTSQPPPDDALLHVNPLTTDVELEEGLVPVTMNKYIDLVGSLLIVALGVFVLAVALRYPPPKVVFDAIGPMGFPMAIGAFLVVGGLVQSVRTALYIRRYGKWAPEEGVQDEPEHPSSRWRALIFIGGCFVFLVLMQPLGFLIAMPLAIVAGLWSMGYANWMRRAVVAIGFTLFAFAMFVLVLGVPLPDGPIENMLIDAGLINP